MLRCLLLALLAAPAAALPRQQGEEFAVMLDAGSSGTRCHVYRWPAAADCPSRLADQLVAELGEGEQITPGLSAFAGNASGVADYLRPLVDFAAATVPEAELGRTPLYLQATAGLRLLPEQQQQELLEAVREAFAASPFLSRADYAEVVSGAEEGANEWTTVNYLRGALGSPPHAAGAAPSGVLGMGGASTQIAFVPYEGTELKAGAFAVDFVGLPPIVLYVHSFLGLGLTEAQLGQQRYLATQPDPPAEEQRRVTDPCLLRGYSVARPVGPEGEEVQLDGGGDWRSCKASLRRSIVNTEAPCPLTPCSFDGVYQPDLQEGQLVFKKSFYEITGFFFTAEFFELPETATLAEMEAAGQAFCALGWEEARSQHPETPEQFLASYCFSSMYFTVLMHHGYGVDKTRTPLHWAEEIDGVGLDWPLGATLRATCAAGPDDEARSPADARLKLDDDESVAAQDCQQGDVPFPQSSANSGKFNFTGDALPPDIMTEAGMYHGGHPETVVSHGDVRARVCVSAAAPIVRVSIPWRRRDYNASLKDFIVRHAASGQEVAERRVLPGHSRYSGEIAFAPSAGAGEYRKMPMLSRFDCALPCRSPEASPF